MLSSESPSSSSQRSVGAVCGYSVCQSIMEAAEDAVWWGRACCCDLCTWFVVVVIFMEEKGWTGPPTCVWEALNLIKNEDWSPSTGEELIFIAEVSQLGVSSAWCFIPVDRKQSLTPTKSCHVSCRWCKHKLCQCLVGKMLNYQGRKHTAVFRKDKICLFMSSFIAELNPLLFPYRESL